MQLTPRQAHQWSMRVLVVSAPATLIIMLAWVVSVIPSERPVLALMVFMVCLATSLGASIAAVGSSCHLAVGRAFTAGMRAGQHHVDGPEQPALRLVE